MPVFLDSLHSHTSTDGTSTASGSDGVLSANGQLAGQLASTGEDDPSYFTMSDVLLAFQQVSTCLLIGVFVALCLTRLAREKRILGWEDASEFWSDDEIFDSRAPLYRCSKKRAPMAASVAGLRNNGAQQLTPRNQGAGGSRPRTATSRVDYYLPTCNRAPSNATGCNDYNRRHNATTETSASSTSREESLVGGRVERNLEFPSGATEKKNHVRFCASPSSTGSNAERERRMRKHKPLSSILLGRGANTAGGNTSSVNANNGNLLNGVKACSENAQDPRESLPPTGSSSSLDTNSPDPSNALLAKTIASCASTGNSAGNAVGNAAGNSQKNQLRPPIDNAGIMDAGIMDAGIMGGALDHRLGTPSDVLCSSTERRMTEQLVSFESFEGLTRVCSSGTLKQSNASSSIDQSPQTQEEREDSPTHGNTDGGNSAKLTRSNELGGNKGSMSTKGVEPVHPARRKLYMGLPGLQARIGKTGSVPSFRDLSKRDLSKLDINKAGSGPTDETSSESQGRSSQTQVVILQNGLQSSTAENTSEKAEDRCGAELRSDEKNTSQSVVNYGSNLSGGSDLSGNVDTKGGTMILTDMKDLISSCSDGTGCTMSRISSRGANLCATGDLSSQPRWSQAQQQAKHGMEGSRDTMQLSDCSTPLIKCTRKLSPGQLLS